MTFWLEVAAGFLGNMFAGFLLVALYVCIQWFLRVTDITIGYGWKWDGPRDNARNMHELAWTYEIFPCHEPTCCRTSPI